MSLFLSLSQSLQLKLRTRTGTSTQRKRSAQTPITHSFTTSASTSAATRFCSISCNSSTVGPAHITGVHEGNDPQRKRHRKVAVLTIVPGLADDLLGLCYSILHVLARVAGDVLRGGERLNTRACYTSVSKGQHPMCPTKMLRVDFQLIKVVQNSHILLVESPEPGQLGEVLCR